MDEDRYVSFSLDSDGPERVQIIGRRAHIERFRPWYERWFTRPWHPFVKWDPEPVFSGHIESLNLDSELSYSITVRNPPPDSGPPMRG